MTNPWVVGARPRTLPAAVVPVVVGVGVAVHEHGAVWWKALLALVVSLALQVGVNYANDYSDGVRGTDDARVGPARLVGGGLKPAAAVKRAALISFAGAAAAGLVLTFTTSLWLLPVGAAAVLAAWFYTGGPRPYGYAGLGELFVFVFFGVVATAGAAFVQTERLTALALVASIPVGLLACALLVVNNLRDIPGDTAVGKRTLAVRLGDPRTRLMFVVLLVAACLLALAVAGVATSPFPAVAVLALGVAVPALRAVRQGAAGRALIPVLGFTGKVQLAFGALLTLGLVLSS
ncbi:MAG: 1,4-dihydroxy-2-naphthoate polyprenyltransferase [Acidimicrobiales bacterium]